MPDVELKPIEEANAPHPPLSAEAKPEEVVAFPVIEKGSSAFYDTEHKSFWLGVRFDQLPDPMFAVAALDRAKFELLNFLAQYHQEQARLQKLAAGVKTDDGIGGLMGRLAKKFKH